MCAYPHPAGTPRLIETHISWVILAGDIAYKIKKPLNLGFLDFSSLDQRRILLSGRNPPEPPSGAGHLPGNVSAITGSPEAALDGPGQAFEWAVKMRAFPGRCHPGPRSRHRATRTD
jgi:aminoglycoside phosphotransferase family enzyme